MHLSICHYSFRYTYIIHRRINETLHWRCTTRNVLQRFVRLMVKAKLIRDLKTAVRGDPFKSAYSISEGLLRGTCF